MYADIVVRQTVPPFALNLHLTITQIGINLTDPIYRGVHHGKQAHEDDLTHVIARAAKAGCRKLMVTGSDLSESEKAVQLARDYRTPHARCAGLNPPLAKC